MDPAAWLFFIPAWTPPQSFFGHPGASPTSSPSPTRYPKFIKTLKKYLNPKVDLYPILDTSIFGAI
jgi:hypothetical protein